MHYLRKANIRKGEKILINGAAGNFGTFAIQLAKHFGAEVTGVDSTQKLEVMRSIGADHVIDYRQQHFTRNGKTYDVILDMICNTSFSRIKRSLEPNGRYLLANPQGLFQMLAGKGVSMMRNLPGQKGKKIIMEFATDRTEDLVYLKTLIEKGKLKCIVDRCYSLEEVPEAHRYVETGEKQGNVAITINEIPDN